MSAEKLDSRSCPQKQSAEHEVYAGGHRSFRLIWKERDDASSDLLEEMFTLGNIGEAYSRVKKNNGAPGVDGMTVLESRDWLDKNWRKLREKIESGKYTPSPVRRVEIDKPDGGKRKLGIPVVIDRVVQQAMAQKLVPIYENLFSDGSYGYRPGRDIGQAITRVKEYAEQGYTYAVVLDLSKYFDTLNHNRLLNILRRTIRDEQVIQMIKRFLKAGVIENGGFTATEEGSPQGGNLSPLLANVYLNEFDQEFLRRGVPEVRYADDIVLLAKSRRAAERLLEQSANYLEGELKLTVNRTKSKVVSVFSSRNFKYLGFTLGKDRSGVHVRVHEKTWKKFKAKLRSITSRRHAQHIERIFAELKSKARGWLNVFGIAQMKSKLKEIDGWLCRRIRMIYWKQWKCIKGRYRNLIKRGVSKDVAKMTSNTRRGYWFVSRTVAMNVAISKKRLIASGYFDLLEYYQSLRYFH